MDVPQYNQDKRPPWSKERTGMGVFPPAFDEKMHIFWGPGQKTNEPGDEYNPPDHNAWKTNQLLMIPQVTRFIYATKSVYDSDEYSDSGVGPPDPPDPVTCDYDFEIIPFISFNVKSAFRTTGNEVEIVYDPAGTMQPNGGVQGWTGPYEGRFEVIAVLDGMSNVIYNGPWDTAPYFRRTPSRTIIWTKACSDGSSGPIPGGYVVNTMGHQHDPEEEPRCWSPFTRYDSGADEIVDAPENGYSPAEVPFEARNQRMCSEDPPE